MKKRIVIIGDSLSMPRPDEGITLEDTYSYLLNKSFEVINTSKRANDTKLQIHEQNVLDDIYYLNPDIIIIYLGIVDCAPRLFSRNESRLISLLPNKLRKIIINFFSKYRLFFTKLRNIQYVKKDSFKRNIEFLLNLCNQKNIIPILINIGNTNKDNIAKSYNFKKNINAYNNILNNLSKSKNINLIDVNIIKLQSKLLNDGIHINKDMHEKLYYQIIDTITKC
jgi:lysophospholipase L1-like esterase